MSIKLKIWSLESKISFCGNRQRQCLQEFNTVFQKSCTKPKEVNPIELKVNHIKVNFSIRNKWFCSTQVINNSVLK